MENKDTKDNNTKAIEGEALGDIDNKAKFEDYVRWYSLPINEKISVFGCKNEVQFREKYNIGQTSLWRWKNKDDFKDAVRQIRFEWGRKHTPNVFSGWLKSCLKGNPQSIELWLAYFEGWDRKTALENKAQEFTNDDLMKLIEVLPEEKQQKFYDTVNTIIIAARDERDKQDAESQRAGRGSEAGESGFENQEATDQNQEGSTIRLGAGQVDK